MKAFRSRIGTPFLGLCQVRSPCQQQSRSDLRECPAVADKSLGKSLIKRLKSDFQTLGHPTSESWLGGLGWGQRYSPWEFSEFDDLDSGIVQTEPYRI